MMSRAQAITTYGQQAMEMVEALDNLGLGAFMQTECADKPFLRQHPWGSCFVAGGASKAVKNWTSMVLSMVELPELFTRAKTVLLYSKFLLPSAVTWSPICRNVRTIANERLPSIPQFAPTIPMQPTALLVAGILVITILERMW